MPAMRHRCPTRYPPAEGRSRRRGIGHPFLDRISDGLAGGQRAGVGSLDRVGERVGGALGRRIGARR